MATKTYSVKDVQRMVRVTIKQSKMTDATFAESIGTSAAELCRFLKNMNPQSVPLKIETALALKKRITPIRYERD